MFDRIVDENREMYNDFNVNWFEDGCSMKKKLLYMTNSSTIPTSNSCHTYRNALYREGAQSPSCIDHIYTNLPDMCSKVMSLSVGFGDHDLIAVSRMSKIPVKSKIICARSYKNFSNNAFLENIKYAQWS